MITFDAGPEFIDEGPRRRRVIFYDSSPAFEPDGIAAELIVGFDDSWNPVDVQFRRAGRTTATDLTKFPWKRWFDLCRDEIRLGTSFDPKWNTAAHRAVAALDPARSKPPGRPSKTKGQDAWIVFHKNELKKAGVRGFWKELQKMVAHEFYGDDVTQIGMDTLRSKVRREERRQSDGGER